MPAKNIVKEYVEGGHYHIYNRGVEKRAIFLDEHDCHVFLRYIKLYLSPVGEVAKIQGVERLSSFLRLNLSNEVDLLAFSLMPNHFHLELSQKTKDGIKKLMHRLTTSYVMYFNKKYKRVGALFQNIYKGVLVDRDEYLLELSRYIHRNPLDLSTTIPFTSYSSYPYYLGEKVASWLRPQEVLAYFPVKNPQKSYKEFVEGEDSYTLPEELLLDED